VNTLDVLTAEELDAIHEQAMRILEEIGTRVLHPGARELLRSLGQQVEGETVRWDRGFVLEMAARAPRSFTVRPRNPARAVEIGGGRPVYAPAGGAPFCSDLERGRRDGTLEDHLTLVKLAHAAKPLTCLHSGACETAELPEASRHLDMGYSILRWSDKPYVCYGGSGAGARDSVELAAIACGGRHAIEETPAILGVANPNSPLAWDLPMVDALLAWAEANQAIAVTPFLLAGATAPVSVAAGLSPLVAEALSGIALAQAVRPGVPCLFGSFFLPVDMRSGRPNLGMPESVLATLAGGQLARRYGLPYRGGGGLCSSNAVDAQAASETAMTLWATHLSGSDFVLHAAGWLEGGLTASLEKLALDLDLLRMFERLGRGVAVGPEELAFETLREEGPGGMFLASRHTLDHFRDWLFESPLFRSQDYATWVERGGATTDGAATVEWKRLLERYEDPGIDPAVDEALRDYVARRKRELSA